MCCSHENEALTQVKRFHVVRYSMELFQFISIPMNEDDTGKCISKCLSRRTACTKTLTKRTPRYQQLQCLACFNPFINNSSSSLFIHNELLTFYFV